MTPADPEKFLLFCLSHAGGSVHFYRPLVEHLPEWIELVPLELPGHGNRSKEPLSCDLDALIAELSATVQSTLSEHQNPPFALFGHSLGALNALLTAHQLSASPSLLFLSSPPILSHPGWRQAYSNSTHSEKEFLDSVARMGGLAESLHDSPDWMAYFVPILRHDLMTILQWTDRPVPPLNVPIVLLMGSEEMRPGLQWATKTTATFRYVRLAGNHFYMTHQWKALADLLAAECRKAAGRSEIRCG